MIPHEFPPWESIYSYYRIWREPGEEGSSSLLEQTLKNQGRKPKTSFLMMDAQSVRNTDEAEQKGYDAGKKISGVKRHIAVDTQGLPQGIWVTTANITDQPDALTLLEDNKKNLSKVSHIRVDGDYADKPFADGVKERIGATVEVTKKCNELHPFRVIPKRWVVERSFGWLEKCRRLWKNPERKLNARLSFVYLAFLVLLLKRY